MKFCTMLPMLMITLAALNTVGCSNGGLAPNAPSTMEVSEEDKQRISELDAYWAEVSRAVGEGDFEAYKATCHEQGVLVSGTKKTSQPLADALARWKKEFDATKAGEMKASVTFRFAQRVGDATTAHESGIFLYTATTAKGEPIAEYINFEGLLVKQGGKWKILMEYQKSKTTKQAWEALAVN